MLILTRRVGESIMIGENIVVTVMQVDGRGGGTVRVGVAAPKGIIVDREEIYERRKREKLPA